MQKPENNRPVPRNVGQKRKVILRRYLSHQWQLARRSRRNSRSKRFGFSSIALGILSTLAAGLCLYAGIGVNAILRNLPDVGRLKGLVGVGGSIYMPTEYYDRTGQHLLAKMPSNENQYDYIRFLDDTGRILKGGSAEYLDMLVKGGYSFDTQHGDQEIAVGGFYAGKLVDGFLLKEAQSANASTLRRWILITEARVRFGSNQLLEWWLNSGDFGNGCVGIGRAANYYLNREFNELDAGEQLLLVVVLLNPNQDPISHQAGFLDHLERAGSILVADGIISQQTIQLARQAAGRLNQVEHQNVQWDTTFLNLANRELTGVVGDPASQGGMVVKTTLEYELSQKLECVIQVVMKDPAASPECSGLYASATTLPPGTRISYLVMDPSTGQVLAMKGDYSPTTGEEQYLTAHPSGSLLTPFIYLTGMLHGMGPASLVWDTPSLLGENYLIGMDPREVFQGPMRLRVAMKDDHLAPAAKMIMAYGEGRFVSFVARFGLSLYTVGNMPYTDGVTDVLSVAQAYGVLANMGNKAGLESSKGDGKLEPYFVLELAPPGDSAEIYQPHTGEQALISPELAYLLNDILGQNGVDAQTVLNAGKNGAVQGGLDHWQVSYAPGYVMVVWMGYPVDAPRERLAENGIEETLHEVVAAHFQQQSGLVGWDVPQGITQILVCDPSGLLPTKACPSTIREKFLVGNEPVAYDTLYKLVAIDSETGKLATVFSDPTHITEQVVFNPPAEERAWAIEVGYTLEPDAFSAYQTAIQNRTIQVDTPVNFSIVKGTFDLTGSVQTTGFVSYRIDIGQGITPAKWLQVGEIHSEIPTSGRIGSIDTSNYTNGLYAVRIQVTRLGGIIENAFVIVLIQN